MSEKLNKKQELAIELVMKGMTDSQIAERVGVSRQRINIWRNQDIEFMQTLQERRRVLRAVHMERLMQIGRPGDGGGAASAGGAGKGDGVLIFFRIYTYVCESIFPY